MSSHHRPQIGGKPLSRAAKAYIRGIIAVGVLVTVHSATVLVVSPVSNEWLVLAALTLLTGSFTVKVPSVEARISVSDSFAFCSVLLFGPAPATLIVALDSFFISLWMRSDRRRRPLFNLAAVAIAIWTASHTFYALTGTTPGDVASLLPLERRIPELVALAAVYFLVNSWLVAGALSFERNMSAVRIWWNNFTWLSLNYFAGISAAALLVSYSPQVDIRAIAFIIPLLLISYFTYQTSLARMEDAKHHVQQLNTLYLSTIETLAMAVDAKDQITHGHIRRVQLYAVELARRLGIDNEHHIQAIEAAALLHDMGKLAIPEHILNKPGKLTTAEFNTMKEHADIGADLLSAVHFPYPVVPIVRHHHENWNGGGYPAGISGTDIPIGARILAVVDCFDALTSDRPYRPRLSVDDAFAILIERRGSMYDPLVVDTFITSYPEIAQTAAEILQPESATIAAARGQSDARPSLSDIFHQPAPAQTPPALAGLLADFSAALERPDRPNPVEILAQYAKKATSASVSAIYLYSTEDDLLTCVRADGDDLSQLIGLTVKRGEKITGWAAANSKTVLNAYASLDLGDISERFAPSLRTAMSAPIVFRGSLLGALACYSSAENAFDERHRIALEELCTLFLAKEPWDSATQTLFAAVECSPRLR